MTEQEVRLLDTNTSNQIAAGEVVEKPASVVKELVENALDAGADSIEVTIFEGGTGYIRVTDNGSGMSEANARLALQRHATSKIRDAEDLHRLHTLGFRGEALPSIASVSRFELLTRPHSAEMGTSIRVEGGEAMECLQTGAPPGTAIIVKDLFFNVPARRKFLKTVSTEGRYITEMLTRIALARPDVRFKLTADDREVLVTPGKGDLKDTIASLYGRQVSDELLPVRQEGVFAHVSVNGFIGKPTLLKGNRGWQTLLVNGRSVNNLMISKAIEHAYQSQIPKRGFSFAVLDIRVDPAMIDVNVHPQKSEVKFSDESSVYKAVYRALTDALTRPLRAEGQTEEDPNRQALQAILQRAEDGGSRAGEETGGNTALTGGSQAAVPPEEGSGKSSDVTPEAAQQSMFGEAADRGRQGHLNRDLGDEAWGVGVLSGALGRERGLNKAFSAGDGAESRGYGSERSWGTGSSGSVEARHPHRDPGQIWKTPGSVYGEEAPKEPVYSLGEARQQMQQAEALPGSGNAVSMQLSGNNTLDVLWPIGQVDKTFIIAQSEDTLYLIDQHAAHERILYDKLVLSHNAIPAQQLLLPLYITLQPEEVDLLTEHHDTFFALGVDVSAAGENSVRVASLPSDIRSEDAEDYIREIARYLQEHRRPEASELRQDVLHMTACRAAIKAGEVLNMRQMRQLILDLCNTTHPFTCPHGRPCMIAVTSEELYKMFKRTGFDLPKKNEKPYEV